MVFRNNRRTFTLSFDICTPAFKTLKVPSTAGANKLSDSTLCREKVIESFTSLHLLKDLIQQIDKFSIGAYLLIVSFVTNSLMFLKLPNLSNKLQYALQSIGWKTNFFAHN